MDLPSIKRASAQSFLDEVVRETGKSGTKWHFYYRLGDLDEDEKQNVLDPERRNLEHGEIVHFRTL
jgi:hypothetical protein